MKKTLKFITLLCLMLNQSLSYAQNELDIVGTWKLKKVVDGSGNKCSGIKKYKLIINADSTYYMLFGGSSWIEGNWKVERKQIKFDAQTVADPCMEWTFNEVFKTFEQTQDGILIIDIYICGTVDARSYFKKKR